MANPKAPQAGDALTAVRFSLTVDGHEIASFSELAGITSEVEPVEYLAAAKRDAVELKKQPWVPKPAKVVLKRGKNRSMELWKWHEQVLKGDVAARRKDCQVVIYNADGKPVARYQLEHAWPSKLEIGSLKAGASEVLMETVTIVCERIQRLTPWSAPDGRSPASFSGQARPGPMRRPQRPEVQGR